MARCEHGEGNPESERELKYNRFGHGWFVGHTAEKKENDL